MRQEDIILIFAVIAFIVVVTSIFVGTYLIMLDDKPLGLKTESHWYRCDANLCRQEKENNCTSVKLSCEVCCDK